MATHYLARTMANVGYWIFTIFFVLSIFDSRFITGALLSLPIVALALIVRNIIYPDPNQMTARKFWHMAMEQRQMDREYRDKK